jgi:peptidoglycan lytic transglycosylase
MRPRMGGGRWSWRALGLAACLAAPGCTLFREPAPPPIVGGVQVGVASWYGPGFHGNRTANGEIFDQYELTAAHPSLPLGTRAVVTNLTNGRAVEVRINDRGPFVDGRAIDLSYAAARTIGMIGPGTSRVRIDVLGKAPPPPPPPPVPPPRNVPPPRDLPTGVYTVEVASLSDPDKAQHLRQVLAHRFPDAFVSPLTGGRSSYYRVRIGPYPLRTAAVARAEMVNRLGYPAIIVEETP